MKYMVGNVLDAKEQFICHGCNALGVMGSGVAKAIRDKWPEVYQKYHNDYIQFGLQIGDCILGFPKDSDKVIGNLITQKEFGTHQRQVNYAAIVESMKNFVKLVEYRNNSIKREELKIAIPRIGAGLGGGDWNIIESILYDFEQMYNVEFVVYDLK